MLRSQPERVSTWLLLLLALPVMSQPGCDGRPKRVPVSGQVLIDGRPLTAGFVRVVPSDARPAWGGVGLDGRFTLTTFDKNDGCVIGTHMVTVSAFEQSGSRWLAPKKYRDFRTSNLTATIDGPTDSLVINLTWEGADPADESEAASQDFTGDVDPSILE